MLYLTLRDAEGEIGELRIRNDGSGDRECGNYDFTITRLVSDGRPDRPTIRFQEGRVIDFPRLELNAWDLVFRSLQAVGLEERNPAGGL